MSKIQSKTRNFYLLVLVNTTLVSVAWMGSVLAQEGGITPGPWTGGEQSSNDPFYACLNVAPDGRRLTAINTLCRGNQGQNQNSIEITWEDGTFPDGSRCNQNSYRNLEFGDIGINEDGSFSTTFENYWVRTTIEGQFDTAAQTVTGTARTSNNFIPECSVNWSATPGAPALPGQ